MEANDSIPVRYSVLTSKNPREIVMLRGSGCKWKRCSFCDYHKDSCMDEEENFKLNQKELNKVQGFFHRLEVINSGSFPDLDDKTMAFLHTACVKKGIRDLHFECHWMHRKEVPALRERFRSDHINVHIKSGVETFDIPYRETVLKKGFGQATPEDIAAFADDVCLLQGLAGQTVANMNKDIETGLAYFDRVCVNIMVENSTELKPCPPVIEAFLREIYPVYKDNERVDILLDNTDFGVGGQKNDK